MIAKLRAPRFFSHRQQHTLIFVIGTIHKTVLCSDRFVLSIRITTPTTLPTMTSTFDEFLSGCQKALLQDETNGDKAALAKKLDAMEDMTKRFRESHAAKDRPSRCQGWEHCSLSMVPTAMVPTANVPFVV
ncbi:expressed unknown protein [Seminavis robusta]|uniref:Uncharacterized protein n=1 Tax=Seminavis robusta TaxID=568900 RepID=A0A9N8EZJ5_9STRA|nr:expressed unknown protein [Seminavis robusta]|eukprot:Sro2429_g327420.1 n/a (131) ;mRNA; f:12331-12723